MQVISWNIQCGLGVDGKVDLARIANVIREMGDADIICLQEVSRFNPDLDMGMGYDQVAEFSALFPEHDPVFGAAIDRLHPTTGQRWQFGNLILSRLPVIQIFNHLLPQPVSEMPVKHMPRQATEIVVQTANDPLRVITTHLEFHSAHQRIAQMIRLRDNLGDVLANLPYDPGILSTDPYAAIPRPANAILCGDFNSTPNDEDYRTLTEPFRALGDGYDDAWCIVHKDKEHAPTCGLYDHVQWPQGAHCRDFFFVSGALKQSITSLDVQLQTDASDHQPLSLVIADQGL
ncbi:MAG: endonuclease/exonuclease/phosphatase family protein [Candidatus Puniceispirillum sp.]